MLLLEKMCTENIIAWKKGLKFMELSQPKSLSLHATDMVLIYECFIANEMVIIYRVHDFILQETIPAVRREILKYTWVSQMKAVKLGQKFEISHHCPISWQHVTNATKSTL
jgi:hypothetical protein